MAGELAVASELCRRNIYAQLTFGNQKKTDLLVYHNKNYTKIEVKCKQGDDWPNCRGIASSDAFLVFVDFAGKADTQRPDYYILSFQEWLQLMEYKRDLYLRKHPDRRAEIRDGCLHLLDEVSPSGKHYIGCGVSPVDLTGHMEKWDKIQELVKETFEQDIPVDASRR